MIWEIFLGDSAATLIVQMYCLGYDLQIISKCIEGCQHVGTKRTENLWKATPTTR